jgi:L-threonylcarbamoyladenylate synthase
MHLEKFFNFALNKLILVYFCLYFKGHPLPFMHTELLDYDLLERAAFLLKNEEVVAFPTETVYGLGASIYSPEAIKKIYIAKGRPSDNPLIAHVSSLEQIEQITSGVPDLFYKLYDTFFPGPLTVVLPKSAGVPSIASSGLSSIAIRMPSHPIARDLIELVGQPLVAPSANLSGRPSSTHYSHVMDDFCGKISAVIKGERSDIGIESTVLSLLDDIPVLMRPGSISKENLEAALGIEIACPFSVEKNSQPICPGMKYRHYAPKAPVILFYTKDKLIEHMHFSSKKRLILSNESLPLICKEEHLCYPLSRSSLYDALRFSDKKNMDEVLVLCDEAIGQDAALMNRLLKASTCS